MLRSSARLIALIGVLLPVWAGAQEVPEETCEALDREAFRSRVVDSQSALDRGDLDLLLTVLDEIERDIPCLEFAPAPRLWADLMVVEAVAAFAQNADWKRPLAAALRIRPGIDRSVGRAHPMYDWLPPPEEDGTPWSGDATLFVDGKQTDVLPPADGWFLVQKTDGEYWETHWQQEEPPDEEWVTLPVERPPTIFWQAAGGLQFGMGHVYQGVRCNVAVTEDPEEDCSEKDQPFDSRFHSIGMPWDDPRYSRPVWGLHLEGKVTYGRLGVELGGSTQWNFAPGIRDARISGIYDTPRWSAGVGLSLTDVLLQTRSLEPDARPVAQSASYLERYYHLMGSVRSDGPLRVEGMVLVGVHSLIAYNALADLSMTFENVSVLGGHPQIGGQVGFAMGRLIDEQERLRILSTSFRATTHVTLRFGKSYR